MVSESNYTSTCQPEDPSLGLSEVSMATTLLPACSTSSCTLTSLHSKNRISLRSWMKYHSVTVTATQPRHSGKVCVRSRTAAAQPHPAVTYQIFMLSVPDEWSRSRVETLPPAPVSPRGCSLCGRRSSTWFNPLRLWSGRQLWTSVHPEADADDERVTRLPALLFSLSLSLSRQRSRGGGGGYSSHHSSSAACPVVENTLLWLDKTGSISHTHTHTHTVRAFPTLASFPALPSSSCTHLCHSFHALFSLGPDIKWKPGSGCAELAPHHFAALTRTRSARGETFTHSVCSRGAGLCAHTPFDCNPI